MLQAEHRYLHTKHMFQGPENFCVHHSRSFSALGDAAMRAELLMQLFLLPRLLYWMICHELRGRAEMAGLGQLGGRGRAERSSLGCGRRQSRRVQVVLSGATIHGMVQALATAPAAGT